MKITAQTNNPQKGFTLIELLIVIAVLGVLATVLLVAINPLEQLARGRDAGRLSTVNQLGHAVQNYATSNPNTGFPATAFVDSTCTSANTCWQQALVDNKDIQGILTVSLSGAPVCSAGSSTVGVQGNVCYYIYNLGTSTASYSVWTTLESNNSRQKPATPCTSSQTAYAVYDSIQGKAGVECLTTGATPSLGATLY